MKKRLELVALVTVLAALAVFAGSALLGLRGADSPEDAVASSRAEEPREPRFVGGRIRVEVLNGAGTAGLAKEATDRLREAGFDVVYFGNAAEFGTQASAVIDRSGEPEAAQAVARALGIGEVRASPDPSLLLEVTVVLGEDWPPPREAEPQSPAGRFWRRVSFWRGG